MEKTGLLLMAYGGPDSLDDIEPYLLDVRGGRPTAPELVEEIRERYASIGGRSPLLDITRRQAKALENELNRRAGGRGCFSAYVGMRHWAPRIREAVSAMQADGIRRAVALVMAPHFSEMSTGVYFKRLDEAVQALDADIEILPVRSWHAEPGLIDALTEKASEAMQKFGGASPYVLFTAHSLPARILQSADPYPEELKKTARLAAGSLGLADDRWGFCYQSAGRSPEPWLGPHIEQFVPELAERGEKNLLVVPVGFVADHVEVLYDIDIEVKALAARHGACLERSRSLNDSPTFISGLADLVAGRLDLPA